MVITVADNIGDENSEIAFIFACPGTKEGKQGIVCYGTTGKNLDQLLLVLKGIDPKVFWSTNRYDYPIINSCGTVYPNSENPKKSEPNFHEIDEKANLERIHEGLKGKKYAICFGKCAQHALESVKSIFSDANFEVIDGEHLSLSNLNRHYKSEKSKPKEKTLDRILQASKPILDYFIKVNESNCDDSQ